MISFFSNLSSSASDADNNRQSTSAASANSDRHASTAAGSPPSLATIQKASSSSLLFSRNTTTTTTSSSSSAVNPPALQQLDKQLAEWQRRRHAELIAHLTPRKVIIMNTYYTILLGKNTLLSLVSLVLYCFLLSWLSQSVIFMVFTGYVIFQIASFDLSAIRLINRISGMYERMTSAEIIDIESFSERRLKIKPLEFEQICWLLASVETRLHAWRIHWQFMQDNSSLMYLSVLIVVYSMVWLLTSFISDSTILFIIGVTPALAPAIYHYDVAGFALAIMKAFFADKTKYEESQSGGHAESDGSGGSFLERTFRKVSLFYQDYQNYVDTIPKEMQPKSISAVSASSFDQNLNSSAFSFITSSMQSISQINEEKSSAAETVIPSKPTGKSMESTSSSDKLDMRNRKGQHNSVVAQSDGSDDMGFEYLDDDEDMKSPSMSKTNKKD